MKHLRWKQENFLEIFKDKKNKKIFWFEKTLVTILFDYKQNLFII